MKYLTIEIVLTGFLLALSFKWGMLQKEAEITSLNKIKIGNAVYKCEKLHELDLK